MVSVVDLKKVGSPTFKELSKARDEAAAMLLGSEGGES